MPQALVAADKVFGSTVNKLGFKVINGCGIIQGDGIDLAVLKTIAGAIEAAGFSAENVAYGMGGGLLQKVSALMPWSLDLVCEILIKRSKADYLILNFRSTVTLCPLPQNSTTLFTLMGSLRIS